MRLFGTSGIRRLVDYDFLDISYKVGLALGRVYKRVFIGTDTRTSSPAVKSALIAGLISSGAEVCDGGIIPTPTVAIAGKTFDCAVMITASHNPPEYNGIKLLNPDGSPFDNQQQQFIEDYITEGSFSSVSWDKFGSITSVKNAPEIHIEQIRKHFPCDYKIRVVADCGGGAATSITPLLLKSMGCNVNVINGDPTGFSPRPSEPTEDNLSELKHTVRELKADLGIAHDGDADRVMAVDNLGRFISGDILLSIFTKALCASKIVTTVDCSMIADEIGVEVIRSAVGDNSVSEVLRTEGEFGGEPSGAWIFPQSSLCPDGIYGAALLVKIASENCLSELVDKIPRYPIHRGNIKGTMMLEDVEQELVGMLDPVSVLKIDGLKLILNDGWALIRPSGTEPKIRLTVETKEESRAISVYNRLYNFIMENLR